MADVIDPGTRDRAQLILVSGLTIAVTLVVLILLLNTTIYTENVATRGIDSDVGDAATFTESVEKSVADILAAEQAMVDEDEFESLAANVTNATGYLASHHANASIERGVITEVSTTVIPGINATQTAESPIGASDFGEVESVRTFELDINGSSLNTSENTTPVTATVGSTSVEIQAHENDTIAITDGAGERCEIDETAVDLTIDIVNGTLQVDGDETCPSLELNILEDELPGTVSIDPGDHDPTGTYAIIVGGEAIHSPGVDHRWFVHELTVELLYRTSDLRFETVLDIPGELP